MIQRGGHSVSIDALELPARPGSPALADAGGALLLGANLSVRFNRPGRPGGGGAGQGADAELTRVLSALEHRNERIQLWGMREARRLGDRAAAAVPKLMALLHDEEFRLPFYAAETLGALGAVAREAWPVLVRATKSDSTSLSEAAVEALAALRVPEALPAVIEAASHEEWSVRKRAMRALGVYGLASLPTLIEGLGDEESAVAVEAVQQIELLGAVALPQLVAALQHRDAGVRMISVALIGIVEPPPVETIPELIPRLRDEVWGVRAATIEALDRLGARPALEPLRDLLKEEPHPMVRKEALAVISRLERGDALPGTAASTGSP